jgi:hypothetical protein
MTSNRAAAALCWPPDGRRSAAVADAHDGDRPQLVEFLVVENP